LSLPVPNRIQHLCARGLWTGGNASSLRMKMSPCRHRHMSNCADVLFRISLSFPHRPRSARRRLLHFCGNL
jgi:hypothetical protein